MGTRVPANTGVPPRTSGSRRTTDSNVGIRASKSPECHATSSPTRCPTRTGWTRRRARFVALRYHPRSALLGVAAGEAVPDPRLADDVTGVGGIDFDLLPEQRHQRPQVLSLFDRVRAPDRLENRSMGQ